ncbi:acetolactate synthase small subunit [Streptomyces axinellae]|uniref:Acetolactate synthase small subunit n=1 Tax=Streptomyces axinellae TaxID=552788 RepID=A0ABP6CCA1_9ACTN
MRKQTLSMMVANKPGALAEVAGLFSRQGCNIDSLAVGEAAQRGISWLTIVASIDESSLEQMTEQLSSLPKVLKVVEPDGKPPVQRGCRW